MLYAPGNIHDTFSMLWIDQIPRSVARDVAAGLLEHFVVFDLVKYGNATKPPNRGAQVQGICLVQPRQRSRR
jgi:hypothetical protein